MEFIIFVLLALVSAENSVWNEKTNNDKKPGYSFESSYNTNAYSESRNGKVTTGSHGVPNDRAQIVDYRADENGYFADVNYEVEAKYLEYKPASSYKAKVVPVVITAEPTYNFPTTAPAYIDVNVTPITTDTPTYEVRSYPRSEFKVHTFFASKTNKPLDTPVYDIRHIGDVKQYEDKIKLAETKVYSSPAYKSDFFVLPDYKVSSSAIPVYEKPASRRQIYSLPVAPVPLAFRALYALKASNKAVDHYKGASYVDIEVPATPSYKAVTTAAPAYTVPLTTTAAPVYSTSTSKDFETPLNNKPSTFFASKKDYISPGYKELSRIFRETSLTAGNKNWDNFLNKAWEFARTKY